MEWLFSSVLLKMEHMVIHGYKHTIYLAAQIVSRPKFWDFLHVASTIRSFVDNTVIALSDKNIVYFVICFQYCKT